MASGDPKIGTKDAYSGQIITLCDENSELPTLYHYTSYYPQIPRLLLVEKKTAWNSRYMNILEDSEHYQPWFVAVSPDMALPTLIHRGKAVNNSRDTLYYINDNFNKEVDLYPEEQREAIDKLVSLHYDTDVKVADDSSLPLVDCYSYSSFMLRSNYVRRKIMEMFTKSVPEIEKLKTDHEELAELYEKKLSKKKEFISALQNPEDLFANSSKKITGVFEELSKALEASGGPFLCGDKYTVADVVFTVFFGRINFLSGGLERSIADHPKLKEWWKNVKERSSLKEANISIEMSGLMSVGISITKLCNIL